MGRGQSDRSNPKGLMIQGLNGPSIGLYSAVKYTEFVIELLPKNDKTSYVLIKLATFDVSLRRNATGA